MKHTIPAYVARVPESNLRQGFVWAKFLSLLGWRWRPARVPGYTFQVTVPCDGKYCKGSHELIVRLYPGCGSQPAERFEATFEIGGESLSEPHPAVFGSNPENTYFLLDHSHSIGASEGDERDTRSLVDFAPDWKEVWQRAGGQL
jgi:hypothetical protein